MNDAPHIQEKLFKKLLYSPDKMADLLPHVPVAVDDRYDGFAVEDLAKKLFSDADRPPSLGLALVRAQSHPQLGETALPGHHRAGDT